MVLELDIGTQATCRPIRKSTGPTTPRSTANGPAIPQPRLITAGRTLYDQGGENGEIFIVVNGWVFLHQILDDGRRQILDFLLPGDICGGLLSGEDDAPHTAEALTDATVLAFPRSQLPAMVCKDPFLAETFLAHVSTSLSSAYEALTDAGRRTALEAVAHLLLRLDARVRQIEGDEQGNAIDFPLNHEHMGDALGLTSVHVCRMLRQLRQSGVATLARGRLHVFDRERLTRTAKSDCAPALAPCRHDGTSGTLTGHLLGSVVQ